MRPDRHATDGNMIAADEHYGDREDDEEEPQTEPDEDDFRQTKRGRKWRDEE